MSRLPHELLASVFLYVTSHSDHRRDIRSWDAISQTCSSWRAIALSTPSLWTSIYNAPKPIARELLKRSVNLPILVSYSCEYLEHITPLLLILHQAADRIRILEVRVYSPETLQDWRYSLLGGKYPLVEDFTISFPICRANDTLSVPFVDSPRLKRLDVSGINLEVAPSSQASLITHFVYSAPDERDFSGWFGLELQSAINLLRSMPLLQVLDVDHLLSPQSDDDEVPTDLGIVQLGCLKKVSIHEGGEQAGYFIAALAVPPAAHSSVVLDFDLDGLENAHTFFLNCLSITSSRVRYLVEQQRELTLVFTIPDNTFDLSIIELGGEPSPWDRGAPLLRMRAHISNDPDIWNDGFNSLQILGDRLAGFSIPQLFISVDTCGIPFSILCDEVLTFLMSFAHVQTLQFGLPLPHTRNPAEIGAVALLWHSAADKDWRAALILPALKRVVINLADVSLELVEALADAFSKRPPLEELHFVDSEPLGTEAMTALNVCAGSITFGRSQ